MVPIVLLIWLLLIIIDLLLWCYFHSNWYLLWTAKYYYLKKLSNIGAKNVGLQTYFFYSFSFFRWRHQVALNLLYFCI